MYRSYHLPSDNAFIKTSNPSFKMHYIVYKLFIFKAVLNRHRQLSPILIKL